MSMLGHAPRKVIMQACNIVAHADPRCWPQGAQDAKRAKVWGTIAKKIIQAAKACGGDPANARLMEVLKFAKAAEVPKDLIDRNIKKATDKAQADYQEVTMKKPFHSSISRCASAGF